MMPATSMREVARHRMVNVKVYMRDTALSDLGGSEDELADRPVIPARLRLPVVA
jgi:hypothetical protein